MLYIPCCLSIVTEPKISCCVIPSIFHAQESVIFIDDVWGCVTRLGNVIGSKMLVVPVFIELSLEDQVISNFVRVILSIPQYCCLNQLLGNVKFVIFQGRLSICWCSMAIVRLSPNCITNYRYTV